ncbi:hypothetical protein RHGRI_003961 [Rhododendron griersonianum]|uniref:Protein TIC 22-like, chloroplastic n=1 Tax=Rhododendron griersonianum TaxID=479676 RepID=A0AAV6L961_9ERIC|nr:hypothetical protein RHGRI_003961 [Rhododendron griersonianum]
MNFLKPKHHESPSPQSPNLLLQQALTHLQTQCSAFLRHHHHHHHHKPFNIPFLNPNPSLLKTHLDSTLSNLHHHAKHAIEAGFSILAHKNSASAAERRSAGSALALGNEAVEERLTGVHVYALGNASEEFVLVSGLSTGKSIGLFCFKEKDAEALLDQMKSMDPAMRRGSKVVAVPLNKVLQLKLEGVAFRLIPELSQIVNALKERHKAGFADDSFPGVPVFQSENLILRSQDKKYRPVFFRKEDLENSLSRASRQQKQLNPAFREGNIQVAVLEDIIQGMKDNTSSTWDDVVFIPPGFDVSTNPPRE